MGGKNRKKQVSNKRSEGYGRKKSATSQLVTGREKSREKKAMYEKKLATMSRQRLKRKWTGKEQIPSRALLSGSRRRLPFVKGSRGGGGEKKQDRAGRRGREAEVLGQVVGKSHMLRGEERPEEFRKCIIDLSGAKSRRGKQSSNYGRTKQTKK